MMITFQVKRHTRGQEGHCVEICDNGELIAVVYAKPNAVKIVSKHISGKFNLESTYPPSFEVFLDRPKGAQGDA
jgi:Fe-S-cluster-containing dehydrogenase component